MARIEIDPNYSSPTFSRATAATDIFKKEDVQSVAAALSTHVHDGTGKGLAIAASGIPAGSITSAMIANATIDTVDLAANSITQAWFARGLNASPTTTSTTFVDLDGNGSGNQLRVDMTTKGGDLLVFLAGQFSNTLATAVVVLGVSLDSAAEAVIEGTNFGGVAYSATAMLMWLFPAVSAGAHNIRAKWYVNAGTGSANGVARQLLVLERLR